jgi:extracellular elastinolytic metalloproteinase
MIRNPFAASTGRRPRSSTARAVTLGAAAVLALGLTASLGPASASTRMSATAITPKQSATHPRDFDLRTNGAALARSDARQRVGPRPGVTSLHKALGPQGVIALDPLTSTPRMVGRLDGFLTGPSGRTPARVVLDYVRSHPDVFRLTGTDLAGLQLRKSYTDISGIHHLSWTQQVGGVPLFGNGLKGHVTRDGRLISVQGSPVHAPGTLSARPHLSAAQARATAIRNVDGRVTSSSARRSAGATRGTVYADGDRASLVAFRTAGGTRLAWQTLTTPGAGQMYTHVVDATTGRVLYRRNMVQSDGGDVWRYWPGSPKGGTRQTVHFTKHGWLPAGSSRLAGNNTHVWSDVNDDNEAQDSEEVSPGPRSFTFPFKNFNSIDGPPCSDRYKCSWASDTRNSWRANRKQNAVQVFYFVNKFHDHLRDAPIGFTRDAGNFEAVDGDAVQAQPDDGADTDSGRPDSSHVDNANMGTPPDGTPPIMQMFLFHDPTDPTDPFLQSNGGDEADVVYHEYTHGLSNRLVVDPNGNSTLGSVQAGSMGEAWGDWYAMDFLNKLGLQPNTGAHGEVRIGEYVSHGLDLIRTQPLDCPVGSTSSRCPGRSGAGPGGYTYGDFGRIRGFPEVHSDGEIWSETLWQLRGVLGSKVTESLVTRAMELSPANPSFLDERNAILQADKATAGGAHQDAIWKVFASRGMGYFAGSFDGDDTAPAEDFSMPPAPGTPTGFLTGRVRDIDTSEPAENVVVSFGGHASGFPNDYAATTGADGRYRIDGIFAGTYPKVMAGGNGWDRQVRAALSIRSGENVANWAVRRDWAALAGGASVTRTNDDSGAPFGCGAAAMFDQSQGTGWSAFRRVSGGAVQPVFVVVELPRAVDVSEIAIDPTATCGDGGSASTGPYSIETSTNGTTWTTANEGTFTPADRGHFSSPPLAPGSTDAVKFVRYTMKDSQVQPGDCPGNFSGCDFIDSRELEVFGSSVP